MTPLTSTGTLRPEDLPPLETLLECVETFVADEQWRLLAHIHLAYGGREANCSARVRDIRKRGLTVQHEPVTAGWWRYRVSAPGGHQRLFP